jgi:two-component system OmpR family sensor kinase
MWLFILSLLASIYYENEKEIMLAEHRLSMQLVNETYFEEVQDMRFFNEPFPPHIAYRTALFDENQEVIASFMKDNKVNFSKVISLDGKYIHFIVSLGNSVRDAKYLVYETEDNRLWWKSFVKDIAIYGILIFVFITFVGIYLVKLFLRPMRESLELLDNFIKDTTHELNTPIAAIIANIETIDKEKLESKITKKIRRVDIAARTISNIYNDLTYLVLHNDIATNNEDINVSQFLCERVDYFHIGMEQKKISFTRTVDEEVIVNIDKNKLGRLIDNLLSNAIKYNKIKGSIHIDLSKECLCVTDTGIGIPKEKLNCIFERYIRANDSIGGFGIGLNIVTMIASEYGIKIEINSEEHIGTEIKLYWNLTK